MSTFQMQTSVPQDGNLSITLPEPLRGVDVELVVSEKQRKMTKEERLAWMEKFCGSLPADFDYSNLRDERDRV